MRAMSCSSGLIVSLVGPQDRERLDAKKVLECRLEDSDKIVRIKIQDILNKTDPFAEEGFDLRKIPRNSKFYNCKIIEIIMSPKVYQRLINNEYYVSRTMVDRIDMTYFEPKKL